MPNGITDAITVGYEYGGERLDRAAAQLWPNHSRSRLKGFIEAGLLTVDGDVAAVNLRLRGGESLRLKAPPSEPRSRAQAQAIALEVLHEDSSCLVLNKPAGISVHPGAGIADGTVENALLHHDPALAALPRAGLVHRLDKDTSGALLVARSEPALAALQAALKARAIKRRYEAVVDGVRIAGGTIEAALGRHPNDRLRKAVRADGLPAVTHFRVAERYRAHSRLKLALDTGRTHQIRVHLQHIGNPIVGDPLYRSGLKLPRGASEALRELLKSFRRQALHALELEFRSPAGVDVQVKAPRPEDLKTLILALRADAATATWEDG